MCSDRAQPIFRLYHTMPRDGFTTFGDLIGQLEQIAVTCSKCGQLGRYSVRRLALAHGLHHPLPEWLNDMARDCSRRASPVAADSSSAPCPGTGASGSAER